MVGLQQLATRMFGARPLPLWHRVDETALARYYRRRHPESRAVLNASRLLFSFLSRKQQRQFARNGYVTERGKLGWYLINRSAMLYRSRQVYWEFGCTYPARYERSVADMPYEDAILAILLALRSNEQVMNQSTYYVPGPVVWGSDAIPTRRLLRNHWVA